MTAVGKSLAELGEVAKAGDQRKGATGRQVLAAIAPGYHGAIAGRKGKKLRAAGNEAVRSFAYSIPGMAVQTAGMLRGNIPMAVSGRTLGMAGGMSGGLQGNAVNERKGYLKPLKRS